MELSNTVGIQHDAARLVWMLQTNHTTYAFGVTQTGYLVHLHWGARVESIADLPSASIPEQHSGQDPALTSAREEYPGRGGLRYGEASAAAKFSDGVRDLDLLYERFTINEESGDDKAALQIWLRDKVYPLRVLLQYHVIPEDDLIIRSATFLNDGNEAIELNRTYSANWHLPNIWVERRIFTLAGRWAEEAQIQERALTAGSIVIQSKKGISSLNALPWFAATSSEIAHGSAEVYFGTVDWSGNWAINISTDSTGATNITGGISDYDFVWQLAAGQTFSTPDFVAGFAQDGMNGVRHRLHHYIQNNVLPKNHADTPRPVLFNSWEATAFDVQEKSQMELAEHAARIGVELFVVDDGWFIGRNDDTAGLGDWTVDAQKFPQGLHPLADKVHLLGMKFGLWVEPEMVNPNSNLYRAHPDWVYSFPTRSRSESRNQLVLNVGREDVQEYLLMALDSLVSENAIDHLKWDMNRPISEPGWAEYEANGADAREIWVRHTRGVYSILDTLRQRHPHLSVEACASGGGRSDIGILHRTDQVWASDNTHPVARLHIQEGVSHLLPARAVGAWVTDVGRGEIPLAFRFHVAMLGAMGVGGDLSIWSAYELDEAAQWIALYKSIRSVIHLGMQDWLLSAHTIHHAISAVQYTSVDQREALVFFFSISNGFFQPLPMVRLAHLQPAMRYHPEVIGRPAIILATGDQTGSALMSQGLRLQIELRQTYISCVIRLRLID